jgi:hypothetical protein
MRMGGKGNVWLVKSNGTRIDITGRGRVELRAGDKLVTDGTAWVIWYSVADRFAHRQPPLPRSTIVVNPPPPGRRDRVIYGARRQGNPPKPANRLFASASTSQPLILIGEEPLHLGTVTVSGDVRPERVTLDVDGKLLELAAEQGFALKSYDIIHKLTIPNPKAVLPSSVSKILVTVTFSDGTQDSATFEMLKSPNGQGSESRDTLRRALDRYSRVKPEQDEWLFHIVNVSGAYEDLGCNSQAAATVLDWWFVEPENESAVFALQGIAIQFDLGAIDARFGPAIERAGG